MRGMTLDLGFAHLVLDDGTEAGIVDVPGHERFLHNMLAGAAGMEVLLLVVAANEGPREQTVEHLDILKFLNVQRTIVAATKIDLISEPHRDQVMRDVEGFDYQQMADVLGLPLGTLKSRLFRARLALRDELKAYLEK